MDHLGVPGEHEENNVSGSSIPFIDDSGSSCASSMMDGDVTHDEDTASLNRLLDDAASREFSINGLSDDLLSLSCGYASLDALSDGGPPGGDYDHGDISHRGSDIYSDNSNRGSDICSSADSQDKHISSGPEGYERWSWRPRSSPTHSRTSGCSSIKSSDANLEEEGEMVKDTLVPSELVSKHSMCDTCEDRLSTSSSCITGTNSSIISCTTCQVDSDHVHIKRQESIKEKNSQDYRNNNEKISGDESDSRKSHVIDEENMRNENVTEGEEDSDKEELRKISNQSTQSRQNFLKNMLNIESEDDHKDIIIDEEHKPDIFNKASPEQDHSSYDTSDTDDLEQKCPTILLEAPPIAHPEMDDTCKSSEILDVSSSECGNSDFPEDPEYPSSVMLNGRFTPMNMDHEPKEVWTPGPCGPIPVGSSTPHPNKDSLLQVESKYQVPHHYISSMRVASMKGAADMGGSLVPRVAAFLRTQYKNLANMPLQLPWCPGFKMVISDFETSLMQVPLASHLKVPSGLLSVPNILMPHQLSFNESTAIEDKPKRVYVDGNPGYGKSTLALKLAYDWSADASGSYLSSFSLVFVVTLRDLRGSLYSHLCKEVLPRHILSKEAMNTLWCYMKKIEEKVLFLLVGYDELVDEENSDVTELIDGLMFPNSTVVLTARSGSPKPLPNGLHRRLHIVGMAPDQTHRFIGRYFAAMNKPDCGSEVMSLISASQHKFSDLITCPIMCLALAVLYEDMGGKLPSRLTDMYMSLLKHMIRKNLLRRGEPMCYDVLPDKYIKLLQDFGKLALEALKNNSPNFTSHELKTRLTHAGEIVELGILLKMKSMSKLNKKDYYSPAHNSFLEFLAAFYMSGLIADPSSLQLEIDGIAEKMDIMQPTHRNNSGLMILRYLVGLLGRNAYTAFNIISQMGVPQRVLFMLLKESGMAQMNVVEVCKHVSVREQVVIQTNSGELEEWGRLLYSPDCTLEAVEVLLDFDGSCRDRHESFFTSMSFNESVKSVKLTCIVGGEFGEAEVTRLVSYVRAVLTKRRLESFEIQVTSLEEATAEILIPVVDMICDTLPDHAAGLSKLVLALELESQQVVRLCSTLSEAPQVRILHLPHLACGLEGLQAVAALVQTNPLLALNLAGSLSSGTPVDERSTGTGASTPSPTREDPPQLAFWNFTDAQGNTKSVFNSLPRSFYQSLPRRGRSLSGPGVADKRNSDITHLQKTSFPPPTCSPHIHSNGFHQIFSSFRESGCRVCHLNINKCTMGAEDLVCLGETVRFTKCLSSLRMEGLSRMAEIIPVLISLQENSTLQLLDLTSPHILLGDAALQVTLNALAKNKSLRMLVISGWTIQCESERSLRELVQFLSTTELQHLDMNGTRVMVTVHEGPLARLSRQDDVLAALQDAVPPLHNNTLAFLNLDNFEIILNNKFVLRGPQVMFLLRHFPKIVDVSLTSNLGADVIDDQTTHRIFSIIPTAFPYLRKLNIGGWVFSLDNCEKVMRGVGKAVKGSQIRELILGAVEVRESSGKASQEHTLLSALITNLHHLSLISLANLKLQPASATIFGKTVRDKLPSSSLVVETRGMMYSSIKAFRQALVDSGKYELEFFGGPQGVYKLRKVDRREKILGKWACISTLDRLSEL